MSPLGIRFQPVLAGASFVAAVVFIVLIWVGVSVTLTFAAVITVFTFGALLSVRFDDYEDSPSR